MPLKCGATLHTQPLTEDGVKAVKGGAVKENLGD